MNKFRICENGFLKVWDCSGYNIFFYYQGDEVKYLEAGYIQV